MFYATAGVKDIDRYHEKLTLSLYSSSLATHLNKVKLGVISKEELPLHYTYVESRKRTFTHLSQTSCCWFLLPLFQPGWNGGHRLQRDLWEAFGGLTWFVQPLKCGLPPGKAGNKWDTNSFSNEGATEVHSLLYTYVIPSCIGVFSVKQICLYVQQALQRGGFWNSYSEEAICVLGLEMVCFYQVFETYCIKSNT